VSTPEQCEGFWPNFGPIGDSLIATVLVEECSSSAQTKEDPPILARRVPSHWGRASAVESPKCESVRPYCQITKVGPGRSFYDWTQSVVIMVVVIPITV